MTYSPAERVTCPHVIHNISGRQSRLSVLECNLHVQQEIKDSCNMASLQFSIKGSLYIGCIYRFFKEKIFNRLHFTKILLISIRNQICDIY